MKVISGLLAALFCLVISSCTQVQTRVSYADNSRNILALQNATAGLVEDDSLFCAGAFISQNEVLTAAHCLRRPGGISIGFTEEGELTIIQAPDIEIDSANVITFHEYTSDTEHLDSHSHVFDVVARNNEKDLVLLRSHETYESTHAVLMIPTEHSIETIMVHDPIVNLGHPAGLPWILSEGFVAIPSLNNSDSGNVDVIIINSQIFFGDSGGPLVDSRGNLIGIASVMPGSLGTGPATWLGIYIGPSEIARFLQAAQATD